MNQRTYDYLVEDRDFKKHLFELELKLLTQLERMSSIVLLSLSNKEVK